MKLIFFLILGLIFALSASPVHAIIIIPAIILIPLAKIIAVIIASLSIPATSLGIIISKITKNRKLSIAIPLITIITIILITAILLKTKNPNNPWF